MKTQLFSAIHLAAWALVAPLIGGCMADANPPGAESTMQSAEPPAVTNLAAAEGAEVAPVERAQPAPASATKPLPPDLKFTPNAADVVKLAQGGVDESVMLSFITNSTGTFNLDSDQIVYLNDLGVSGTVIAAMIQHDHLLREAASASTAASPPAAPQPSPPPADQSAVAAAAAPQALPQQAAPAPTPAEATAAPATTVNYNYFYNALAPYGTWVEVEGYGSCWQPNVVVLQAGWQPYCHGGRWIYTDCGWYWHSDYSWGWAPFHYGRWFRHPRWGWCWYPGYVWGPAWVTWRYTDGYCGWAPLAPGLHVSFGVGYGFGYTWFTFVPWGCFWDYRPHRHCVSHHHARKIYEESRPAERGLPAEKVKAFTKIEGRRARIHDAEFRPHGGSRERLERHGKELVVSPPRLPGGDALVPTATGAADRGGRDPLRSELEAASASRTDRPAKGAGLVRPAELARPAAQPADRAQSPGTPPTARRKENPLPGIPPVRTHEPTGREPHGRDKAETPRGRTAPRSLLNPTDQAQAPGTPGTPAPAPSAPPESPRERPHRSGSSSVVVVGRRETGSPSLPAVRELPPSQGRSSAPTAPVPTKTEPRLALNDLHAAPSPVLTAPSKATPPITAAQPSPAEPRATHTWSAPPLAQPPRSEIPRVTRGIQDRPVSGNPYTVYSPQAPRTITPSVPGGLSGYPRPQAHAAPTLPPSHAPAAPPVVAPPRVPSPPPVSVPAPSRSMGSESGRSPAAGPAGGRHREVR